MIEDWRPALVERLLGAVNDAGAWGYRAGSSGSAEPTALAALALSATGRAPQRTAGALTWLAGLQRDDGAVPVSADVRRPSWPTALALLAWLRCTPAVAEHYAAHIDKALNWILDARGRRVAPDPAIHDHDSALVGWSWVAKTHSWIEPTAYALLALRAAGRADHPRVREGVELILDRALPAGGWNYGNRRVLENVLRPFPATTGVALAALAGEPCEGCIQTALDYLTAELRRVRAPLSLAWGLIGLRAWHAQPPEAETWLEACAGRLTGQPPHPHYDALLLLAGAETGALSAMAETRSDG